MVTKLQICQAVIQGVLFAVNTVAAVIACIIITRCRPYSKRTVLSAIITMLVLTFIVSATTEYLIIDEFFYSIRSGHEAGSNFHSQPAVAILSYVALVLNCLVGDVFVTWRTWNIRLRSRKVLVFFGFLILCSIITGAMLIHSVFPYEANHTLSKSEIIAMWAFPCTTFVVNISSTLLILHKLFNRRLQSRNLGVALNDKEITRTLAILIGSGAVYSAIWASAMIIICIFDHEVHYFVTTAASQSTVLYPTLVTTFVHLYTRKKRDRVSTISITTGIAFIGEEDKDAAMAHNDGEVTVEIEVNVPRQRVIDHHDASMSRDSTVV